MADEEKIVVHIDADLKELIPGYIEKRYTDIETIRSALQNGEYVIIERLGHGMKGSGGGYGFEKITEIGKTIELAAKDRNAEQIISMLEELKNYLDRLQIVYE